MNTTSPRSPRQTHAETGRLVKVTLAYDSSARLGGPYQITRITNEIAVVVTQDRLGTGTETKHVGDYLTEAQATDLLTEPGLEVTVVPAKE